MSTPPRRVIFRFEFGGATGWGHIARCSALAHELARRDWECMAWTNGDLRAVPDDVSGPFAAKVVGETPTAIQLRSTDWIVVDSYEVDDVRLREWRSGTPGARWLVMDDEACRRLDAVDLILNSALGLTVSPYANGVRALLGERYALLRPGLARPVEVASAFAPNIAPILIMLGGTDPCGLTAHVVNAIADVDAGAFAPVVVHAGEAGAELRAALARFSSHQVVMRINAAELAGWAARCRAAVTACGGSIYELAALGVPFAGLVVAENQRRLGRAVADLWNFPVIDAMTGRVREAVAGIVRTWHREARSPVTQTRAPIGGIDLLGATRVADALRVAW